jgi:hypothetical protein
MHNPLTLPATSWSLSYVCLHCWRRWPPCILFLSSRGGFWGAGIHHSCCKIKYKM